MPIYRFCLCVCLCILVQSNFVLNYTHSLLLLLSNARTTKRNTNESFTVTHWLLCVTQTHTMKHGVNISVNHKRWNQINEAMVQVHIIILSASLYLPAPPFPHYLSGSSNLFIYLWLARGSIYVMYITKTVQGVILLKWMFFERPNDSAFNAQFKCSHLVSVHIFQKNVD